MARDEDEHTGDWYVLAQWHAPWHHVQLFFLLERDGQPAPDWHPTSSAYDAYKWRSYHAARKYQREHEKELSGYFVCNLSEIHRDWLKRIERKP